MHIDKLVTTLLTSAVEVGSLIQTAKSKEAALYLQGCRDTLLALAKAFKQSCPLAVGIFQQPVTVVPGEQNAP